MVDIKSESKSSSTTTGISYHDIDAVDGNKTLNSFDDVAGNIKKNGKLPANFITKIRQKH